MKRRQFLRQSALTFSAAALFGQRGFALTADAEHPFALLNHFSLTDFDDAQDEGPILIGNGKSAWLVTLQRLDYPEDKERIALYELEGGNWREAKPVTAEPGQFEALTAHCATGGDPVLAWTELKEGRWTIVASTGKNGSFETAVPISDPAHRAINPVAKAVGPREYLVAWEEFGQGRFTLWMARFANERWSQPVRVAGEGEASYFDPAVEVAKSGEIYFAYSCTDGPHRNIYMAILDPHSLQAKTTIPVAIGGGHTERVNINWKPALAFDKSGRLWVSWESNRNTAHMEDSDSFTGDRCCAMVCYRDGKLYEPKQTGRWLFTGMNDHLPTFHRDAEGNLYALTHCGGYFDGNKPVMNWWSFRASYLDPATGWTAPVTYLKTKQKGEQLRPSILFAPDGQSFWMTWKSDETEDTSLPEANETPVRMRTRRRGRLQMEQFAAPRLSGALAEMDFVPAVVEEHHPVAGFQPYRGGRPRIARRTTTYNGETYTLIVGDLHEHSEHSLCWPAGTDGTFHDDLRYAIYSEGLDFFGMTDHDAQINEVFYRKCMRMADFYNDPDFFVGVPALEWTKGDEGAIPIRHGVGHRNLIFPDITEARKFIRNRDEIYSWADPETALADDLWAFIHSRNIDCVAIPHHPADSTHTFDWETHHPEGEPVVEIFQCRGNAEYRGAPRMINESREHPTTADNAFVDYALRDKKFQLGFIASGDHNNIGTGIACLWVKEVSRKGILEALRARRTFATTGEKILVDLRVNGVWGGETTPTDGPPKLSFRVEAVHSIASIDILRNSRVVYSWQPAGDSKMEAGEWVDPDYKNETGVLYYYARVMQQNNHIAWSSPVWVTA